MLRAALVHVLGERAEVELDHLRVVGELAAAARKRGVDVDAATLSALPYEVLLSAEVAETLVQ